MKSISERYPYVLVVQKNEAGKPIIVAGCDSLVAARNELRRAVTMGVSVGFVAASPLYEIVDGVVMATPHPPYLK